jgi:hypothetical protein
MDERDRPKKSADQVVRDYVDSHRLERSVQIMGWDNGRVDLLDYGGRIMSAERYNAVQHGGPMKRHFMQGVLLDCRGEVYIDPTAQIGNDVKIISVSHYFGEDCAGEHMYRNVSIAARAYIGTGAMLYACWIQHHAIVGMGAVVKSVIVPAYTVVDGNPAVAVAKYNPKTHRYEKLTNPEPLERWKHD